MEPKDSDGLKTAMEGAIAAPVLIVYNLNE
jgi:hypothetical protein